MTSDLFEKAIVFECDVLSNICRAMCIMYQEIISK